MSIIESPTISPTEIEETGTESNPDTPWSVIVWNDPINLMSYVTLVFREQFGYNLQKAEKLMSDVHNKGRANVWSGTQEQAEMHMYRLHDRGLWATIEKDT